MDVHAKGRAHGRAAEVNSTGRIGGDDDPGSASRQPEQKCDRRDVGRRNNEAADKRKDCPVDGTTIDSIEGPTVERCHERRPAIGKAATGAIAGSGN
jgi:hypothetical protein